MTDESFVFRIKADFLKALAHSVRLRILECLRHKESSVGALCHRLDMEQSVVSKHLAVLKQAGIVHARKERATVYYSVKDQEVFTVLRSVNGMLKRKFQEGQRMLDRLNQD